MEEFPGKNLDKLRKRLEEMDEILKDKTLTSGERYGVANELIQALE